MLAFALGYFGNHFPEGPGPNLMSGPKIVADLQLIYQNVRGLNTKLNFFRLNLLCLDCDLIAVTESFLTDAVENPELVGCEWSVERRDRAGGLRGGGVLLAARPGLVLRRRRELETLFVEDLWVVCTYNDIKCFICVVYIPPGTSDDVYMRWFQAVESVMITLDSVVIVVGDLNLNPRYTSQSVLCYYGYFLSICGLSEMNDIMNAHGGKLDVVLASERIRGVHVSEIEGGGLVPRRDAYHPPLEVSVPLHEDLRRSFTERIDPSNLNLQKDWNFAKGDYQLLYKLVSEVNWREELQAQDIDMAVDSFYKVLYSIFDVCIPRKTRNRGRARRYPVWFTADLISDLKIKADVHRQWKATKNSNIYATFSGLRADIKKRVSSAYNVYIHQIQAELKTNPRAFWRHIDGLKSKGGFVSQVAYEGKQFVGPETAEAFARFFSSVFLPTVPRLDSKSCRDSGRKKSAHYIDVNEVTLREVEMAIKHLKPNSAVGPDKIPAYIVKGCIEYLVEPLCFLFNLALSSGSYPQLWRTSRVRPIPKTSDAINVESHRPIAILSTPAKLFESILHRALSVQLKPFLSDAQHGFRANRSVNTNLTILTDIISEHLDKGIQVDVLYFDFQKAFDRVDNDVLLQKLDSIGFASNLLKFFASYLRDRQQYVQHGHFISTPYHTRSGVSQGSVLGPFLFGIMVNDLELVVRSVECLLYADDLKLVYGVEHAADCISLQDDIDSVWRWSVDNKLSFNAAKCGVCSFSRACFPLHNQYVLGDEPINRLFSVKDLGVLFDTRLTFHDHIKALAATSFRSLGFVFRNTRDFQDPVAIKVLFNALVRSKLEASAIVWNPYESTYILLLEKVQKAFLRMLYKKLHGYYPYLYPTKFLLGALGFNSLEVRRNLGLLLFVCRVLRGDADCPKLVEQLVRLSVPDVPRITLRPRLRPLLCVPAARTAARRHSPLPRALALLNSLLVSAPECDLLAGRWAAVTRQVLIFCEKMDDRVTTVPT